MGKKTAKITSEAIGPVLAENLLRLGYADVVVRAAEISRLVSEKTGRSITRQRISAIMNAVRVEPETIALIAEGLGVEAAELTKPTLKRTGGR